mgnify:CR=1 FL=1
MVTANRVGGAVCCGCYWLAKRSQSLGCAGLVKISHGKLSRQLLALCLAPVVNLFSAVDGYFLSRLD